MVDQGPTKPPRVSLERQAIESLRAAIGSSIAEAPVSGMGALNRLAPESWKLKVMQQFQFGDLRYETEGSRVLIEVESGGGLTNLVKYWPMLGVELNDKRFALAHLFRITSEADYVAHRRLWDYLVERMRDDLATRNCHWDAQWHARLFTYGHTSAASGISDAADYVVEQLRIL